MTHGNWTATSASAQIVAADEHREVLLLQHTNVTQVALGIGEAAEANEGIQLFNKGDTVVITGAFAREAIYAIGNGGTGTYQDGDVQFFPGPYVAP